MLSVVISAWNEAKNLPRVVASVAKLADEIVVIDTQSTDDTAAVAQQLGCRVFSHPYTGIVEHVRNFSISKATGDWILLLDADEEVPPTLSGYIKKLITENRADYCRLTRKNLIFDKWIRSDHWWPDYVYRLFKKGAISWQDSIHSIPITQGIGFDFPAEEKFSLIHYNYQSISQFIDRLNRYTDFQARELEKSNTKFHWTDLIRRPTQEFLTHYFSRKGHSDGLHGLALSLLQAFSCLVVYLKLWEFHHFAQVSLGPKDIHQEFSQAGTEFYWWYWQTRISASHGLKKYLWKIKRRFRL
jgi:glycosyltransferase involved in cell wall biosynthesis